MDANPFRSPLSELAPFAANDPPSQVRRLLGVEFNSIGVFVVTTTVVAPIHVAWDSLSPTWWSDSAVVGLIATLLLGRKNRYARWAFYFAVVCYMLSKLAAILAPETWLSYNFCAAGNVTSLGCAAYMFFTDSWRMLARR